MASLGSLCFDRINSGVRGIESEGACEEPAARPGSRPEQTDQEQSPGLGVTLAAGPSASRPFETRPGRKLGVSPGSGGVRGQDGNLPKLPVHKAGSGGLCPGPLRLSPSCVHETGMI